MKRLFLMFSLFLFWLIIGINLYGQEGTRLKTEEIQNTLKEEKFELPFWKRLGVGIGYSGGIYHTGRELMKYTGEWDPFEWLNPRKWTYWLNSIEGSISYQMNKKWGIEIGGGYGWANIEVHKYNKWKFQLVPLWIGYTSSKNRIRIGYILGFADQTVEPTGKGYGKGFKISFEYRIDKIVGLFLSLGKVNFTGKEEIGFPVKMLLNGIGFSISYNFNLKGSVK